MKRYSAKELAIGTEVELEHTSDRAVARRIAKDHLDEDPKYYSHLAECGMLHNPTLAPQKENGVRAIFWEDRWIPLKKNQYHEDFAAGLGRSLPSMFRDGAITQWDGIFNLNKLTKRTQRIIADRLIDVPVIGIDRIEIYTNSANPHEERYFGIVPIEQAMTADYSIHGTEQVMTPNSWNQYIRGEYWYYDGQLYDADSNVGKGHEQVAQDLILDMDQMRAVAERWYSAKGVPLPDWLDDETEPSEALHRLFHGRKPLLLTEHEWEQAWTEALGKKWFDLWRKVETSGRFLQGDDEDSFSMELLRRGAIRIIEGYVEVWKLDKQTLANAQDALWEIMQAWSEEPSGKIALEEVHPERRSVHIDLAEFLDAKSPKQVWDAQSYQRNASGHYVWVVDSKSMPVIGEGPYGPFSLDKAEAFARIGAQYGARGRVVSKGLDPESRSFDVVRVYLPGGR